MKSEAKILGGILLASIVILIVGIFFLSKGKPIQSQTPQETQIFPIDYSPWVSKSRSCICQNFFSLAASSAKLAAALAFLC